MPTWWRSIQKALRIRDLDTECSISTLLRQWPQMFSHNIVKVVEKEIECHFYWQIMWLTSDNPALGARSHCARVILLDSFSYQGRLH